MKVYATISWAVKNPLLRLPLIVFAMGLWLIAPASSAQSTNSWIGGIGKWETATNWSLGTAPSSGDLADLITNGGDNTATIDATTTNTPGVMVINNLAIVSSIASTNALILNNAGTTVPLQLLGGSLTLDTNSLLVVNNSVVLASNSTLSVGYGGASSTLVVSNGGALFTGYGYISYGSVSGCAFCVTHTDATNNIAILSDSGSIWSNSNDIVVGYFGESNQLIVTNGGAVFGNNGYLSYGEYGIGGSQNNSALVTGTGSVWASQSTLYIGYLTDGGNSLMIADGGAVQDGDGYVGFGFQAVGIAQNPGSYPLGDSGGNSVLVTGNSSVWSNSGPLYIGFFDGFSNDGLTIANGASVYSAGAEVGDNASGSVLVTGTGSVWNINGSLIITDDGFGNLTITNGGVVNCSAAAVADMNPGSVQVAGSGSVWRINGNLFVGENGYGPGDVTIVDGGAVFDNGAILGDPFTGGNVVSVSGTGSVWVNQSSLSVGPLSSGNQLNISTGGLVVVSTAAIGSGNGGGNQIIVSGGAFYATNSLASGELSVDGGTLTLNSGTVTVDSLVCVTGSVSSVVNFNGAFLSSKATAVTNGLAFVVGDGMDAATFHLNGGVHSFVNSLEISNNATLSGCGTINGNVTIDPGGTVIADCGGTLTFSGMVTNNGSIIATNGTTIDFPGPVAGTGTVTSTDGTVQFSVTINTGTSPSNGGSTSGAGIYYTGTNVTVCATPNSCYSFVNWTDPNSNVLSTASCYTFTATSNETLVANFAVVGANGNLTTLWTFPGGNAGASPEGPLAQGSDGDFYGTTVYGGPNGSGTVFRITPDGSLTNLHSFGGSDGAYPSAGLVEGSDGNFYGTTANGGTSGYGTVFRISPDGTLTTLVSFTNGLDGGYPYSTLVEATDGNFYGTTFEGGLTGGGTVFRVAPSGSLSNLCSFTGDGAGIYPFAGLIQGTDGNFYGTATYGGANNAGLVFRVDASGNLTNLHSFASSEGSHPYGTLVQGGDGNFYGTTYQGGANGYGSVYRISPSGNLTNLWSFTNGVDGGNSFASLFLGSDGNFYGTTFGSGSGPSGYGTVFEITAAGNLTNLWEFTGCGDGGNSYAGLVQGNDGSFYGTTYGLGSGPTANGTLFQINTGLCAHGVNTSSAPLAGGSTSGGGIYACGSNATVCASPNTCYSFVNWTDQYSNTVSTSACYAFVPVTNLVLTANFALNIYAVTTSSSPSDGGAVSGGGTYPCGTNLTVTAMATNCFSFVNWTDQNSNVVSTSPSYTFTVNTNLTLTANFAAVFYTIDTSSSPSVGGSTSGGGMVSCGSNVMVCASPNTCYNFVNWTDQNSNVVGASACLTFLASSNQTLVANFAPITYTITTTNSPASGGSVTSIGTVPCGSNVTACASPNTCYSFVSWTDQNSNVISTSTCVTFPAASSETLQANFALISYGNLVDSSLTNLWSFTNGRDGAYPAAALVQGSDGNFYGTTSGSGSGPSGYGTVFQIQPEGDLTNLLSFTNGQDGAYPYAALVQGSDGNFYGVTTGSGSGPSAYGTVFQLKPGGSLTNLWSFTNGQDGAYPYAALVQGSDGNFYGVTTGSGSGPSAYGTVFRITSSGSLTNLYSFRGSDGAGASAGLVQGGDGNFYGTTPVGGAYGYGTVFQMSSNGVLRTLWSFTNGVDGANSYAPLVPGLDGSFYGTTSGSGSGPSAKGTVFRISSSGSLTTLWSFNGCSDGSPPSAGLVQGSDGNFYGTTSGSGSGPSPNGTVFQISASGSLTTLWSFTGGSDGANPYAGLVQGVDGNFYGTASVGGASGDGTVFELHIPLNPPANQIIAIQVGGSNVVLTLPSVAGETYQLQFSNSMTPTNWNNVAGGSITNCIGGPLSLTNFGGALQPQGFYRFDITP